MTKANHIALEPNFVDDAKARLLSQFKASTNINNILEIEATRFKTADDDCYGLAVGRLVTQAIGVALDNIGQSLGIARAGFDDQEYRQLILFKTYSSNLSPTRDELHTFISAMSGDHPELTTFHTSTNATNTVGYTSCYKYVDVCLYPDCLTTSALDDIVSAFPVVSDVTLLGKDLYNTLGCIALAADGTTEINSNQARVKGLAAIDSGDIVASDNCGSLPAIIN